jgi:hypothetical protein
MYFALSPSKANLDVVAIDPKYKAVTVDFVPDDIVDLHGILSNCGMNGRAHTKATAPPKSQLDWLLD